MVVAVAACVCIHAWYICIYHDICMDVRMYVCMNACYLLLLVLVLVLVYWCCLCTWWCWGGDVKLLPVSVCVCVCVCVYVCKLYLFIEYDLAMRLCAAQRKYSDTL